MKVGGHFVCSTICLLLGLQHRPINNTRSAGIRIVRNPGVSFGAQIVNARRLVHEVKAEVI